MKRLIAKRRLKHGCDQCRKSILKGHVYYRNRTVFTEDNKVYGYTVTCCSKCNYKAEQRYERQVLFNSKCTHPKEFVEDTWTYITGESVKEPSHSICRLCGNII